MRSWSGIRAVFSLTVMMTLMASVSFAEDVTKDIIRDDDGNFMVPLLAKRIECKTKSDPKDKEIFLLKTSPLSVTIFNKDHKPTVLFESKTAPLEAFCGSTLTIRHEAPTLLLRCLYKIPFANPGLDERFGEIILNVEFVGKGRASAHFSKKIDEAGPIYDWKLSNCSSLY